MSKRGKLLLVIYMTLAVPLIALGFAGLFSRKMGFRIPIVSSDIIPALHQHAVWGETLKGRAILLGGEDWLFLIILGVLFFLGIVMIAINSLLQKTDGPRSTPAATGKRRR
jgi:hypothetical protein